MIRELDPKNEHGQFETLVLGELGVLFNEKKFGEAADKVEAFLGEMKPKSKGDVLYWAAGVSRLQSGDQEKGKNHLKKLVELYPDSSFVPRARQIIARFGG